MAGGVLLDQLLMRGIRLSINHRRGAFIETVGVGQDEVEIVRTAHTSLVVTVPGLGDDIQAIKAGILEIGDVFVVNKADRADADRAVRDLRTMIEMNHPEEGTGGRQW